MSDNSDSENDQFDFSSYLVPTGNPTESNAVKSTKPVSKKQLKIAKKAAQLAKKTATTTNPSSAPKKASSSYVSNQLIDSDSDSETKPAPLPPKKEIELLDSDSDSNLEKESKILGSQIRSENRRKAKSGAFSAMGLSEGLLRAIKKKGYKQPTPIQRKIIPKILDGRDVVGMARTGSGKTAAFLFPIIERLVSHRQQVGIRSLILLPSRELAIQIYNEAIWFIKNASSDLRVGLVVGGDSLESQFSLMLTENPDIVISTPGRLLHLAVEMELGFSLVEIICFDEADRLFEMGFAVQLTELLNRIPRTRQTFLFSATLPENLVEFVKAGLNDPEFIRLDKELKTSENLSMAFFTVQQHCKDATLLNILSNLVNGKQAIVFVATKHNVEYLSLLLSQFNYSVSSIYGSMDQTSRQIQMNKFRKNLSKVLIVTDVAARGLDIPILDYVINYNFVDNPKVFIHRVGRVARAGRLGWAYSLITTNELPYLLDLQLFLNKPLSYSSTMQSIDYTTQLVLGQIPIDSISLELEQVTAKVKDDVNLFNLNAVAENGLKRYNKTKISFSQASYKKAKTMLISRECLKIHPLYLSQFSNDLDTEQSQDNELERQNLVASISNFKPNSTIFEVGLRGTKLNSTPGGQAINSFRQRNTEYIKKVRDNRSQMIGSSGSALESSNYADSEFYISHKKEGADTEKGYAMLKGTTFAEQAQAAMITVKKDDVFESANMTRWDSKKKNFVKGSGIGSDNKKYITTEGGVKLPMSYKSNKFNDFLKKSKLNNLQVGMLETAGNKTQTNVRKRKGFHKLQKEKAIVDSKHVNYEKMLKKQKKSPAGQTNSRAGFGQKYSKPGKKELLNAEQIRKKRSISESKKMKSARPSKKNKK
ncbi:hypothetical protein BB561_002352 [Smittium simulii]|uniref:RNA helicase n=1 Tax=Smittium simulii TaxID=133385 RepID=A0A2T9YQP6_9FUNG|nr:hypothetical protein BB561_002352 [Smittium simulii]